MIAYCPAHNQARIRKLARDNVRGDLTCDFSVIGHTILLASKKHVARYRTPYRRKKTAIFSKKRDRDIVFRAESEKKRRTEHIAEAHDAAYRMNGELQQLLLLALHHDRLALFVKIRPCELT